MLKRRIGGSGAEATATVVIERAYDVLCLLVLLFVTLPWLPHVTWLHAAVLLAIVLAAGLAIAIVVLALFGARPSPSPSARWRDCPPSHESGSI